MSGEVCCLGGEKTRLLLSITIAGTLSDYVIRHYTETTVWSFPNNYCNLEFPTRRGKNDYVPRRYINMIQSPYPSKMFTRKPNQLGMHLGCISLQTPPLPSIAYCVGCSRIMIIISSLHSKCISSFASISLPSLPLSTMDLCLPDLHDSPDIPSAHRTHIHLSRALIACNNMSTIVEQCIHLDLVADFA